MSSEIDDRYTRLQDELKEVKDQYREQMYAVTHDLAAPFRQIEGFASIILSTHGDQFDDKTKRHFEHIINGSVRGKVILEALSEYSQLIDSDMKCAPLDCEKVVAEVISELRSVIEITGAEINYSELPVVNGDSEKIYLLFYHLLHNALHYQNADNVPQVTIDAIESERFWEFCISDNGIGVGDKIGEKVFVAFKRGVSDKKYSGVGMGLTIAKSVVRRHGGEIWVAREQETGSSLCFTLPRDMSCD